MTPDEYKVATVRAEIAELTAQSDSGSYAVAFGMAADAIKAAAAAIEAGDPGTAGRHLGAGLAVCAAMDTHAAAAAPGATARKAVAA